MDAYYGDPSWKPAGAPVPLEQLAKDTEALRLDLQAIKVRQDEPEIVRLRHTYLDKQLHAVAARLAMLSGIKLSFDDEAARLYDATPPTMSEADFQPAIDELERLLPGKGSLIDRYAAFRAKHTIPTAKLDAVFRAAGRFLSNALTAPAGTIPS